MRCVHGSRRKPVWCRQGMHSAIVEGRAVVDAPLFQQLARKAVLWLCLPLSVSPPPPQWGAAPQ